MLEGRVSKLLNELRATPLPAVAMPAGPLLGAHTSWSGTYVCAQGTTAVQLQLWREGDALTAQFDFGPVPFNPGVPRGSFVLTGQLGPHAGSFELVPNRWVSQPLGYRMVGMTGVVDVAAGQLYGRMEDPQCGTFWLARAGVGLQRTLR